MKNFKFYFKSNNAENILNRKLLKKKRNLLLNKVHYSVFQMKEKLISDFATQIKDTNFKKFRLSKTFDKNFN